jgi:hypothetical protein
MHIIPETKRLVKRNNPRDNRMDKSDMSLENQPICCPRYLVERFPAR